MGGVRRFPTGLLLYCLLSVSFIILLTASYLTNDRIRLKRDNDHNDSFVKDSVTQGVYIETNTKITTEMSTEEENVKAVTIELNKDVGVLKNTTVQLSKDDQEIRNTTNVDRKSNEVSNLTMSTVMQELSNSDVISVARNVSLYSKTIMVTVVNDAFLPFAYSWLCNTKHMDIHKSVLVITGDTKSKENLTNYWPELNVFVTDISIPNGNQEYSHVGYIKILIRRTEIILSLLLHNMDVLLFECDYTWFANPILEFQGVTDADMLVNPVSARDGVFNGGLVYLFATERTKSLWRKLTEMMDELGERANKDPDDKFISESENDQQYLSQLVNQRYGDIRTHILPLDKYADGMWYKLTESERNKTHPVLISNNWIIGIKNKMARAKEWKHWFIKEDGKCDEELVRNTFYT